jgi:hypothetical protein
MVDFSETLKKRLNDEGIELAVTAGSVDVPRGHLAVILTLSSPDPSLGQRLKAQSIVNEECIKYLHSG